MPEFAEGYVLAIDYGKRRVGIAIGNTFTDQAKPLKTIAATPEATCFATLLALHQEWNPVYWLMGYPVTDDAKPNAIQSAILTFGNTLKNQLSVDVLLVNEAYSSRAAEMFIREEQQLYGKTKLDSDNAAATIIAQSWLRDKKTTLQWPL